MLRALATKPSHISGLAAGFPVRVHNPCGEEDIDHVLAIRRWHAAAYDDALPVLDTSLSTK
jgi:hypothetical protein